MNQLTLQLKPHNNHYLFSDYYLDNRVSERREWREADVRSAFKALAGLWHERKAALTHANEAQTEEDWIKPVLKALGHHFTVQVSIQVQGGSKTPDYILCPDEAARAGIQNKAGVLAETDLAGALAVADAKAWDRPLDRTLAASGVKTLHENPGLQIDTYIRHSGLDWGVLTNGRLWRLYHKDSSKKLDVFYEVDLPALLEADIDDQDRFEAFKYFWLFFRREAFTGGAMEAGSPGWLELVRSESESYERGVSENLKKQVYDALQALAQGFLDFPANGLEPDPATLKTMYDNSLIVLYRLLFIFYAEARDLLPVRTNETYRETYSLQALKRRVASDIDHQRPAAPSMAGLWERLRDLWRVIDAGDGFLGVPAYNGGLFKPANHPFLARYRVGDSHLRTAIDKLARIHDPKTGKAEFVDYRDLEIRHLGSIYEGLLEYHVVVDRPEGFAQTVRVSLLNDKGERKATGSYYTPDYIVQYIVEHTVGPVLQEAAAPYLDANGGASDPAGLEKAVLAINVLDPAMGSGHFLVAAADFIARFMVERGISVRAQGLAPQPDDEGELAFWRRRAAQACIYGVDLNPLAVELAKLSLWLATVSKDKPLSFLDHHLRCGNSLIGARVADLPLQGRSPKKQTKHHQRKEQEAAEAGQLSMLNDTAFAGSMRTATGMMGLIESLGSDTLADVRQAETVYRDTVRAVTQKARLLADLWTARHFGLDIPDDQWQSLAKYTLHGGFEMPGWAELIARGQAIAGERRFFHWELEFPEVFFDEHGRLQGESAGFEAVIGNPPYVRQEQMAESKPYLAEAHRDVYSGTADLYVYFYRQGLELLKAGAPMSYIVTNKWLRAGYGESLRGYFAANADIVSILDFGHAPIFEDADTFPCIVIIRRKTADAEREAGQTQICLFPREMLGKVELDRYMQSSGYAVPAIRFGPEPWSLERQEVDELMAKIRRNGVPLEEFLGQQPYRGILTGFNQAFLIEDETRNRLVHDDPNCVDIIKPYLRGQDIKRWTPTWAKLWMIVLKSSENYRWPWSDSDDGAEQAFASTFPSIFAYFQPFRERLQKRQDQGRFWWELRSCTYYEVFEQPKIAYQEIQFHPSYSFDRRGFISNNKVFVLPTNELYTLAILNSPLMWWHNWRYLPHMKDEALSPKGDLMISLPIAPPTDELRTEIEPRVERLIDLSTNERDSIDVLLDWLAVEFGIDKPGQRLENPTSLGSDEFVAEVKKRLLHSAKKLTPAALKALRSGFAEQIPQLRNLEAETQSIEHTLSDLVNQAYGLTPAEVALMWETAPPRMPLRA
ncbi:MAG: Eco57I restriction-modification methylase domain-containing protein [Caldilineales bacterium]|nr:Eco57I restriction-modification methylase domain-containing protein [Caldilineales bacterium]